MWHVLMLGGFCIWPKLLLQTSFKSINEIYLLCLVLKNPALCALLSFHFFVKDKNLTIYLVFFTIPVSYYNEFLVITKMTT